MDLGLPVAEFLFFLILAFFFCLIVVLPSDAMQSAGFTISKLFSPLLGEERFNFVEYHLRRTLLTMLVHASLPFLSFVGLEMCVPQRVFSAYPRNFLQFLAMGSLLVLIGTFSALSLLYMGNWGRHHLVKKLRRLAVSNGFGDWQEIAQQINIEVRQPMLFSMINKDCSRTLVTSEWILKISNYDVHFARIADSQLWIVRSSPLQQIVPGPAEINNNGAANDHLIDLRVQSISQSFEPFFIRIRNQQELNNLRDQIGRPIEVLDSLVLPQPLHERFVEAFLKELEKNQRHRYAQMEELEPCLGCSQTPAQVKLVKHCVDSIFQQQQPGQRSQENCQHCQCRPMWCARCMGRIFASKQDQSTPELWMAGRAPCPTCRATFCPLDVCMLRED